MFAAQANPHPAFVVAVGGFPPRDLQFAIGTLAFPVLHIMGERDELVSMDWSLKLALATAGCALPATTVGEVGDAGASSILVHPGSHVVPSQAHYRHTIVNWIKHKSKL